MDQLEFPPQIQRKFPSFCQRVAANRNRPPLPDGYVVDAFYTSIDDLPCESHKEGYIWQVPYTPDMSFTVATIFFGQEVVFSWYAGQVYVNRVPRTFSFGFETNLGERFRDIFEDEHEPEPEHYEVPVDQLQATIDLQSPDLSLSKYAYWKINQEIQLQRVNELKQREFDRAMAEEAERRRIEELRHWAFEDAMADEDDSYIRQPYTPSAYPKRTEAEQRRIDELKQEAFNRAMAEC